MLGLQEISDRMEIQQLITDYSTAVDTRDFERLLDIFTPDAVIDYSAVGGTVGTPSEVVPWLRENLAIFSDYLHLVGNHSIVVDGDTAAATSTCVNPMVFADTAPQAMMIVGVWYHDTFVRTHDVWRMSGRVEQKSFMHSM
ncbi:nuclear transport factor 2 family protein [Williamsia phyllosphaerae]|uniref:SnoaL-like domain-containing protein n=1 Tax=Williamsia phyllosphaerae TaxID=885042 RepID=A0ABQ1V0F7_9NOCA|nr:nuclear transport factor 2 family protein [Williamsia phyllosphaerae]GGF33163.1 hypothetical protein GCM10007298_31260 [Williamsia phyllosphaerae]